MNLMCLIGACEPSRDQTRLGLGVALKAKGKEPGEQEIAKMNWSFEAQASQKPEDEKAIKRSGKHVIHRMLMVRS
jgi:hypothetical protein